MKAQIAHGNHIFHTLPPSNVISTKLSKLHHSKRCMCGCMRLWNHHFANGSNVERWMFRWAFLMVHSVCLHICEHFESMLACSDSTWKIEQNPIGHGQDFYPLTMLDCSNFVFSEKKQPHFTFTFIFSSATLKIHWKSVYHVLYSENVFVYLYMRFCYCRPFCLFIAI